MPPEKPPLRDRIYEFKKAEEQAKERLREERAAAPQLVSTPASQVKRERLKTYFGGRLIQGAFQLLVGPGEAGKGMVSVDIVATLTTGRAFAGERTGRDPMNVMVCITEDSEDRVAARLEAAGADMDRAHFIKGPPTFRGGLLIPGPVAMDDDAGAMLRKAQELGAGALFLETMLEHLGDRDGVRKWSSNNEAEVRKAIAPIVALCREAKIVGWGVMHPRKTMDGGVEDSISGSAAFRNVGRGVLHVYRDPRQQSDCPDRLFICSKANYLAQRPPTLRFRIESWERDADEGRVVWGVEGKTLVDPRSAEDVWREMQEARAGKNRNRKDLAVVAAEKLLTTLLKEGPMDPELIRIAATDAGMSWRTVETAKANLRVVSVKKGMPARVVGWTMPEPSEDDL